jgi:alpha-beta hydrolase superfamily lysophospholipase
VSVKLYPLCRHEILNEINREDVYEDILAWMIASIINK